MPRAEIAEVAAVTVDAVDAVLGGGSAHVEADAQAPLAEIEATIFIPFAPEEINCGSVELTVANKKGNAIATTTVALTSLAKADRLMLPGPMKFGEPGREVDAQIKLVLNG